MPRRDGYPSDSLQTVTRPPQEAARGAAKISVPALTILAHPDPSRVGERAVLADLLGGKAVQLSRLEPRFTTVRGGTLHPLGDPHLSRRPFSLSPTDNGGLRIDASGTTTPLVVDGESVASDQLFHRDQLSQGVVLVLGGRVALVLRSNPLETPVACAPELIGESAAMTRVRREIERVADLNFPVLVRGESGTGKELVARAIHDTGRRREQPYLALNIGAIPQELAAAELFGATKGAYTGAHRQRQGFFQRAQGGTLFLDEIGVASREIQVLLLRALETGEIQPVGSEQPEVVDVRVVSATDADLESAIVAGDFRSPLLHRLAAYELVLPPLRQRRDDFGCLFFHFLRSELTELGEAERLLPAVDDEPWVPADLVARLALFAWPGNVRQLKNVVRQLAVASRGDARLGMASGVERLLANTAPAQPGDASAAPQPGYRRPSEVSDDELIAALRAEGFNLSRTAVRLGVSRTAVYKRVDQCPQVRKASDLGFEDIQDIGRRQGWDLDTLAASLEVSHRGLLLRMKELGIKSAG